MRWGPKAISVVTRTCLIEFVKRKSKREILSKLHSVSARFQDKKVLLILIEDFFHSKKMSKQMTSKTRPSPAFDRLRKYRSKKSQKIVNNTATTTSTGGVDKSAE